MYLNTGALTMSAPLFSFVWMRPGQTPMRPGLSRVHQSENCSRTGLYLTNIVFLSKIIKKRTKVSCFHLNINNLRF